MHDFNEMVKIFKTHDIKKIIFAGKFYRKKNYRKKISREVKEILDETKFFGDDSTLKKIKNFFENNGFVVVSPKTLIKHNFKANEIIFNNRKLFKLTSIIIIDYRSLIRPAHSNSKIKIPNTSIIR